MPHIYSDLTPLMSQWGPIGEDYLTIFHNINTREQDKIVCM